MEGGDGEDCVEVKQAFMTVIAPNTKTGGKKHGQNCVAEGGPNQDALGLTLRSSPLCKAAF